jgi:putative flippase GtrA
MTSAAQAPGETPSRVLRTPLDRFYVRLAQRLGGGKAKEVERFLKFATIGIVGATVDFGTLNLLHATVLPPETTLNVGLSTTIAFVAAILNNFLWNRFWTYPDSRSRSIRRQLTQFFIVSIIGWIARTIWITATYASIGVMVVSVIQGINPDYTATDLATNQLGTNVSQLIAVFVVMIWNFFANRYWTFNDVE